MIKVCYFSNMDFKTPWSTIQMAADKTATINISGYIGVPEDWQHDEEQAKNIVSTKEKMRLELDKIANMKADSIELNIDSFGGDVNHGLSIYNALANNPAKVTVNYTGWSASIATVIAAAGDVVNAPNNFMGLLHEARGIQMGTKSEMESYSNFLDMVNNTAANIYAHKASDKPESFLSIMGENSGEGTWRSAEQLKEAGLIDNVFEPIRAAASADDYITKAKKFGLNSNINMSIFNKKDKKQVNMVEIGDVKAVYDGELKAGVQLLGVGADVTDGTFECDGNSLEIENSVVKSISAIEPEMVSSEVATSMVANATAELTTKLETVKSDLVKIKAEKEELQGLYDNLANLSSTHKPKKTETVDNTQPVGDIQLQISASVKEIQKQAAANVAKTRGVN